MAPSPVKQPPAVSLRTVITKTNKILISNRRHFISLTLLFILPSSIISTIVSLIQLQSKSQTKPIISIIYAAVNLFPSLMAAGTVMFSAHQILSDRHVKLVTSIKSLRRSFFPLLTTNLCSMLVLFGIVFVIVFGVVLCTVLILVGFEILGSDAAQVILNQPISPIICVVIATAIMYGLIMYFTVNFALSSVIATVEFSHGFESLRRSTYLVKGTRQVILKLMLIYQIITGFAVLGVWFSRGDKVNLMVMKNWMFVCGIVISAALSMVLTLHQFVAFTVLYVQCKGVHGEFAGGKASDDVAREYTSLLFDDGKLEHDGVSMVPTV